MILWYQAAICFLLLIVTALSVKLYLLRKSTKEIEQEFTERILTDTNTLISISTNDRHMRKLAAVINEELLKLRAARQRFQQGDQELKNAVTNISHDLRTPLTAIYGYLDLLEQEPLSDTASQYLNIIRNRTEVLAQLSEELFRYSIIISSENTAVKEPVVLNRVLEESIAAFYTTLSAQNITPKIQIPERKITRMLDPSALERVFSNLFHNAIKYSDGDLEITLSESGSIVFANAASALDNVQVGRLFERFYTVETAGKSTGLGLAISRTLVEQMGGSISANYENHRLHICISFPEKE